MKKNIQTIYSKMEFKRAFQVLAFLLITNCVAVGQPFSINGSLESVSGDTVELYIYSHYSYYWGEQNAEHYSIPVVNKTFCFQSLLKSRRGYISAYLKNKNKEEILFLLFLVSRDDSIHLVIRPDTMVFAGRGSQKFTCQYLINKVPGISFTKKELMAFPNTETNFDFNMYAKKRDDSLTGLKLSIIEGFKKKLPIEIFKLLQINVLTQTWFMLYNSLSLDFRYDPGEDSVARTDKIRYFNELEKYQLNENTGPTLLAESSSAPDYLMRKAVQKLKFDNYLKKKPAPKRFDPLELARVATKPFKGLLLRERLYAQCFYNFYRPQNKMDESKLETALRETTNDYFHNYLSDIKLAMDAGLKVEDYKLFNLNDEKVTIGDFKGKVVVIDFWFRGCGYCAILEQRMKSIRHVFQNDTAVVFVAVNLDINKAQFVKGVASGKYTGENEVNLYTGGSAFNHPLAKNYQIIGCPELVIIDKQQRTFISKPPRPVNELSDRHFINLILKAERLHK